MHGHAPPAPVPAYPPASPLSEPRSGQAFPFVRPSERQYSPTQELELPAELRHSSTGSCVERDASFFSARPPAGSKHIYQSAPPRHCHALPNGRRIHCRPVGGNAASHPRRTQIGLFSAISEEIIVNKDPILACSDVTAPKPRGYRPRVQVNSRRPSE